MQEVCGKQDGERWTDNGLLVIRHLGEHSSQVFGSGRPFQLDQLHIGVVVSGGQDVTVNLRQHHLERGSVLVASPESIMQEDGRTDDFDMQVIHVSDTLLHRLFNGQVPVLFAHRMNDLPLILSAADANVLQSMLDALWLTAHSDFTTSLDNQLTAVLNLIVALSQRDEQFHQSHQPRHVVLFNRFLSLVAENCDSHRTLDFYADRLCLSKQYLGSIIVEVSHRNAREWIDEAAIQRIKVMLQHSTTPLNEISERMSFAEPSHFSRYFKRLTGLTPNEYRCGMQR